MRGKDREALIEKALIDQYEKYYLLAYDIVKGEAAAMNIVNETAYKAIYFSERMGRTETVEDWIERIFEQNTKKYRKGIDKCRIIL